MWSVDLVFTIIYNMEMIAEYFSPIGRLMIKVDRDGLRKIDFGGMDKIVKMENDDVSGNEGEFLQNVVKWLDEYFSGREVDIKKIKLAFDGTEFQKEVWGILQGIRYGETLSYGDIAEKIAKERGMKKMSARAVGQAVGRNPIPIIVPCHRVVGKDGKMTGYSGGMERKIWLLDHERKAKH